MNNNYGNRLRTKFSYSQKFLDEDIKKVISKLAKDESKKVSRELTSLVREDWGNVKYNFME